MIEAEVKEEQVCEAFALQALMGGLPWLLVATRP